MEARRGTPGTYELVKRPYPCVRAGSVLVKTEIAAGCVDDRMYTDHIHEWFDSPLYGMGHEGVGAMLEAPESRTFKPGDRVLLSHGAYCGRCFACQNGLSQAFCASLSDGVRAGLSTTAPEFFVDGLSPVERKSKSESGWAAMGEYRLADEEICTLLPDDLSLKGRDDMSRDTNPSEESAADWRLKSGAALFGLSIVLPVAGIPLVTALGLSTTMTASVSGALLVGAEVLGVCAVAVMGKSGYAFLKNRVFGFLKQHGPPQRVSRGRYNIGLVMFCVPLLFGWSSPYISKWVPGLLSYPIPLAIGGDILILASLLVLGGDFWDKIRSLFIHDTEVRLFQESNGD